MKLSKEARKLSKQLYQQSFTNGVLDAGKVKGITASLCQSKPRDYFAVLKNYQRLVRMEVERRHAAIESAAPLDNATREKLVADLRSRYGADMTTEFKVNVELLGGLRIKIGSDVWDGSVRNRLQLLKEELLHA